MQGRVAFCGLALVFLALAPWARADLLAYYSFESGTAPAVPVVSGECTPSEDRSGTGASFSYSTAQKKVGDQSIQISSGGYVDFGTWKVNSVTNTLTVMCWVRATGTAYPDRVRFVYRARDDGDDKVAWSIGVQKVGAGASARRGPRFILDLGSAIHKLDMDNPIELSTNTWYHVAGVYDGTSLHLYLDGVLQGSQTASGTITEKNDQRVRLAASENNKIPFEGFIDEVKIFDVALSASQILAQYQATAVNQAPQFTLSATYSTTVLDGLQLSPVVTDETPEELSFLWAQSGGTCGQTEILDESASEVDISFSAIGTFDFSLQVKDSELCTAASFSVTVDGSQPLLQTTSLPTSVNVFRGVPTQIFASASGFPTPAFVWQEWALVNVTDVPDNESKRLEVFQEYASKVEARLLQERHERGVRDESDDRLSQLQCLPEERSVWCLSGSTVEELDEWEFEFMARSVERWELVEMWVDIPGANSPTYTTPPGSPDVDGMLVRVKAFNFLGDDVSDPITLVYQNQGPPGGDGDGDGDVATIVGPVVGGLAALLLCCCLVMAAVVVVAIRRGGQRHRLRLVEPDYEPLMFGDYTQEPSLNDKQINKKRAEKIKEFEEFVMSDMRLLDVLCKSCSHPEHDRVAKSLVVMFQAHDRAYELLEHFITMELQETLEEATLFRANSIPPKMFKNYAMLVALPFLWSTLALSVHELNRLSADDEADEESGGSSSRSSSSSSSKLRTTRSARSLMAINLEVDPHKMDEASDPEVNTLQLWLIAQKILSSLTRSHGEVPEQIRAVLRLVHDSVKEKFPGEEYKSMGGFLFLRLVCPSLTAPHVYGLLESPPSPTAQRQLILISKVLQNLSNGTLPGAKEEFMEKLNHFILNNQEKFKEYLTRLIENTGPTTEVPVPDNAETNAVVQLLRLMHEKRAGVLRQLDEMGAEQTSLRLEQLLNELMGK